MARSSSEVSRRTLPGTPATSEPGGTTTPCDTTAPAATTDPRPTVAPFMITAPMPMRQSSSTVHPWTTAQCPTVTLSPIDAGKPGAAWTTVPSWMLVPSPTVNGARSARTTAVYQTPVSVPIVTCPATTAPGATHAPSAIC